MVVIVHVFLETALQSWVTSEKTLQPFQAWTINRFTDKKPDFCWLRLSWRALSLFRLILRSRKVLVKVSTRDPGHTNCKMVHYKYLASSESSANQFNTTHAYLRYLRQVISFDFISHLTIYLLFLNNVILKSSLLILKPKTILKPKLHPFSRDRHTTTQFHVAGCCCSHQCRCNNLK